MSNGSIDSFLMNAAWKRLWTPGTPYYLPDAMLKGVNEGGIVVTPYGDVKIAQVGPVPLFDSSTWGSISITLTNSTINGVAGVSPSAFNYADTAKTFSATINWGPLRFSGQYLAQGGGVVGCAMSTAKLLLGGERAAVHRRMLKDATGAEDDPQMALAASYRDQLVAQPKSGSGLTLVGSYYDNNDTLNEICAGDNVFTFQWPAAQTQGLGPDGTTTVTVNSEVLADQTTVSAQSPSDATKPVGYPAYSKHSFKMQGLMIVALQKAWEVAPKEDKQRYLDAMNATLGFKDATTPDAQTQTVGTVMNRVATTPPPSDPAMLRARAAEAPFPWQDEVDAEVEQLVREYEESQARRATEAAQGGADFSSSSISGSFSDSVPSASLTINGTVAISGQMPNITLTVTITTITANVPTISITLSGSGSLLDAVQNYIANSNWVQTLLQQKVASALQSDDLKKYLSNRMNQALAKVWGGD